MEKTEQEYAKTYSSKKFLPFGSGSPRTQFRQRERVGLTKKIIKYSVNETFFDIWSDDLAWVLGLIWTDGHLTGNTVSITSKDKILLEKVNSITGNERPLRIRVTGRAWDLSICNRQVVKRLREIGLISGVEGKTRNIEFPNMPFVFKSSFVRGLIDGDGCITRRVQGKNVKGLFVYICGASNIFKGLVSWLREQNINHSLYFETDKMWRICIFRVKDLKVLYNLLYPTEYVSCLQRKRAIYDAWILDHTKYSESIKNDNPLCKYCKGKTNIGATRQNGTQKFICRQCKRCTSIKPESLLKEWNSRPACPHCKHSEVVKAGIPRGGQDYRCKKCNRRFHVPQPL